jgi:hypothetical protein
LTTALQQLERGAWLAASGGTVLPQHTATHPPGVEQGGAEQGGGTQAVVMRVWVAAGFLLRPVCLSLGGVLHVSCAVI